MLEKKPSEGGRTGKGAKWDNGGLLGVVREGGRRNKMQAKREHTEKQNLNFLSFLDQKKGGVFFFGLIAIGVQGDQFDGGVLRAVSWSTNWLKKKNMVHA